MKQSPLAKGYTTNPDRSNGRYCAVINRACVTLALTLALAGPLFLLKGLPQSGQHPPAFSVEQVTPQPLQYTQIEENTSAGSQPATTYSFHQSETKREVRSQTFYAHARAQGIGLDFAAGVVRTDQPKRFDNWNDVFAPEGAANKEGCYRCRS